MVYLAFATTAMLIYMNIYVIRKKRRLEREYKAWLKARGL